VSSYADLSCALAVHIQYRLQGKEREESSPSYIITDALHAYESAFRKEFDSRRTAHIKTKSLSEGFANRPIERWYNEVREVTKTRRGFGNNQSAKVFADLKRIEHNFCRPHLGLPNKNIYGTILCIDKFRTRLQLILLSGGKRL
jgi:hypothetical protein